MSKDRVVYCVGDESGKSSFESALEKAAKEKGISPESLAVKPEIKPEPVARPQHAAVAPVVLPDLTKIKVPEMSVEELARITEEGRARKVWAEEAGGKLAKIQYQIKKLEQDKALVFSAKGRELLAQYKADEAQLLNVGKSDETLQGRMEFSKLMEEIRATDRKNPNAVRAIMGRLVNVGRFYIPAPADIKEYRLAHEGKYPSGTIFLGGKIYFSSRTKGTGPSDGQKAIEAETRKMADEYKAAYIVRMKTHGNHDLAALQDGKPGVYYVYSPARTEKDGRKFSEGHALVEVYDQNNDKKGKQPFWVLEAVDVAGSLVWMTEEGLRCAVPFFWFKEGRVIVRYENRLEDADHKRAMGIIGTLKAVCRAYGEAQNAAKAKVEANGEKELVQKVDELLDKVLPGAMAPAKIEPPTPPVETATPEEVSVPAPEASKGKGKKTKPASK